MSRFVCSVCHHFASPTFGGVFRHIRSEHSCEPNFRVVCGIDGCSKAFTNFSSWRSHIRRVHKKVEGGAADVNGGEDLSLNTPPLNDGDDLMEDDNCDDQAMNPTSMTRMAAMFILKTRDGRNLTQTALDGVVSDTTELFTAGMEQASQHTLRILQEHNVDEEVLSAVGAVLKNEILASPFHGLETEYKQNKYFVEHFGMIEPVERTLGQEYQQSFAGGTTVKPECCYDIPVLDSLQSLLNCDVVIEQIFNPHFSTPGVLGDYCDGKQFKSHPLFSKVKYALQLMLYYDDVEVCNPLGSAATAHKLGLFYYVLGNLEPRLRSPINSIQLIAVVKTKLIDKYGMDKILEPFVRDVMKLESDSGVEFLIQGEVREMRGTVSIGSADNLASQELGGYKALAAALRKCRNCLAVDEDVQTKFVADAFAPRTVETHKRHCELLNGPLYEHAATTYGLTRDSILNSLRFFHVTSGLPPDVMHDVLEGVVQLEMKCMLTVLIREQKLFSLDDINTWIRLFPYGNDISDPPKPLPATYISGSYPKKQGAMETWSLARMLPLLIGDLVPEDSPYWQLYLLLLKIVAFIFAPKCTTTIAAYLRQLIEEHHTTFRQLYPDFHLTPKMHYMVHIPNWIVECGPLVHQWCMRFESKHRYFKQIAKVVGNFKNISKTLAFRHQRSMCYILSCPDRFLADELEVGPMKPASVSSLEFQPELVAACPTVETTVQMAKWVKIQGSQYKIGDCVVLRFDGEIPVFGKVSGLVIKAQTEALLVAEVLQTLCFVEHFHSYQVSACPSKSFVCCAKSDLADHHVLSVYQPHNSATTYLIPLKYYVLDNFDLRRD